jgi:hypothetical protein
VNPIFAAALEIQAFCEKKKWGYCIIGGVAVQRWGEPRLTRDVDLTVLSDFGSEKRRIEPLIAQFDVRRRDALDFALRTRVVLLKANNGVPLDVSLGAMPFEERIVARASRCSFAPGAALTTCSAEDLIVLKAFANRDKDWLDVDGVILRQADQLDVPLIWQELDPLVELKEEPEIRDRLGKLLSRDP